MLQVGFIYISSGNKPEHSDALMMSGIGLIRGAELSLCLSENTLKAGGSFYLIICSHFSNCGWFKRCELRI